MAPEGRHRNQAGPSVHIECSGQCRGKHSVMLPPPAPIATAATVASLLLHQRAKERNPSGAGQRRARSVASTRVKGRHGLKQPVPGPGMLPAPRAVGKAPGPAGTGKMYPGIDYVVANTLRLLGLLAGKPGSARPSPPLSSHHHFSPAVGSVSASGKRPLWTEPGKVTWRQAEKGSEPG